VWLVVGAEMNPFGDDSFEALVDVDKSPPQPMSNSRSKQAKEPAASRREPVGKFGHCNAIVNERLFVWAGWEKGLPEVHTSPEKTKLTSHLDVFNFHIGEWNLIETGGDPHLGVRGYACTPVGSDIYYFGGYCGHDKCRHSSISSLNTSLFQWRSVPSVNDHCSPMRKSSCGMVTFIDDGDLDYLFIFGGIGMLCSANQPEAIYIPCKDKPDFGWTNECNIFSLKTSEWITPKLKGERPPPCAGFTLTKISHNQAILYGGYDAFSTDCMSDIYIVEMSKECVNWHKLPVTSDNKPYPRYDHAAVCISGPLYGHMKAFLMISGGKDLQWQTLGDAWLLDCTAGSWIKLETPERFGHRQFHSLSAFPVYNHCICILAVGGIKQWVQTESPDNQPILSDTYLLEMCLNEQESQWEISAIIQSEALTKTDEYKLHLIKQLFYTVNSKAPSSGDNSEVAKLRVQLQQAERLLSESNGKVEALEKRVQEVNLTSAPAVSADANLLRAAKAEMIAIEMASSALKPYLISNNEITMSGSPIDKGAYYHISTAQYKDMQVAAKVLKLNGTSLNAFNKVVLEHELVKSVQIRHPNIAQLLFASIDKDITLVMETPCTTLRQEVSKRAIPNQEVLNLSIDIASALAFLHNRSHPITHRGVASNNIILEQFPFKWRAKLTDFFTGNFLYYSSNVAIIDPAYVAPDTPSDCQSDIFSFGVVIAEMITRKLLSVKANERESQLNDLKWPPIAAIIKRCVTLQMERRPTAKQLLLELRNITA
jgi:serine/threonine protein kinase